jgi:hypothetical protein
MRALAETAAALRYLAEAIDAKDPYTWGHADRVARYCMKILDRLPELNTDEFREMLVTAAFLHDVGKVRVPDKVLKKRGSLTAAERMEIELHPVHAMAILGDTELRGSIGPAVRGHHEKLDGTGYPDGLRGDEIPMAARIISIADCFDAITSKRIYRRASRAFSDAEALAMLARDARDGRLDPAGVAALHEAYAAGTLLMARAASYSSAANPLVTTAGGEKKSPMRVARGIYRAMLSGSPDLELSAATRFRIAVRLATLANLQGDAAEALEALARADEIAAGSRVRRDIDPRLARVQRTIALRLAGDKQKAADLAAGLQAARGQEWLVVARQIVLGDVAREQGEAERSARLVATAQEAVAQLRRRVQREQQRSPLGVSLRWWSENRVAMLEGELAMLAVKHRRRSGRAETPGLASAACEQFELLGRPREASEARCERGRYLSEQGDQARAIFILERERSVAEQLGDELPWLRRTCWLAEACSRRAASLADVTEAAGQAHAAFRLLAETGAAAPAGHGQHGWLLPMAKALVCWNLGQVPAATAAAAELAERLSGLGASSRDRPVPHLMAAFIAAAGDPSCSGSRLLALVREVPPGRFPAIRVLEVLAEALRRDARLARRLPKSLLSLRDCFGGRCWLDAHPRYAGTMRRLRGG